MSNFPSVRPSLNLQFDSQPTPADMTSHLASVGATFSRASIGTYTDANGLVAEASAGQARPNYSSAGVHEGLLIEESRTNNIVSSENFISPFTLGSITVYKHQIISPDGKANGTFIVPDTANTTHRIEEGQGSEDATATWTATLYIKEGGYNSINMRIRGNGTGNGFGATFDLGTETASAIGNFGTGSHTSSSLESVGNGWYRCTVTGVPASSGTGVSSDLRILNDSNVETYAGDGTSGLYLWGWQLEAGSFPTSYIPTIPTFSSRASTATFFNASGVLSTASTNVARTDHKYIDGQWVEAGLLLEGLATNLVEDSEDFSTNFWTNNDDTVINQAIAPNGEASADLPNNVYPASGIGDATTIHTVSVFAKTYSSNTSLVFRMNRYGSGADYVQATFNLSAGTVGAVTENGTASSGSASIEDYGDGWYRCILTGITSTTAGTISVNPQSQVYLWGAQLETGSQPTSYIATSGATADRSADVYTTATKVRSADVCYIDGTAFSDFYNQDEGTVLTYSKCDGYETASAVFRLEQLIIIQQYFNNGIRTFFKDADEFNFESGYSTPTNLNKIVVTYDSSNLKSSINGESVNTASVVDAYGNGDRLSIGGEEGNSSRYLNGSMAKLIYFPRALTDNELIKLTQ